MLGTFMMAKVCVAIWWFTHMVWGTSGHVLGAGCQWSIVLLLRIGPKAQYCMAIERVREETITRQDMDYTIEVADS